VKIALLALLLIAAPNLAVADGKREARVLFRKANDRMLAGDYVAALELFRAAYQRFNSPKILLNVGTCLGEMGRNAEAAETYQQYLGDPKAEQQRKTEVLAILQGLDAQLGHLRLPALESGTRVLVDGRPIDAAQHGSILRVEPGSHVVVAENEGRQPMVATVSVGPGEQRAVELVAAEAAPPAEAEPLGTISSPVDPLSAAGPGSVLRRQAGRASLGHGGQIGASARTDIDGKGRGAILAVGLTIGLGAWLEPGVWALLGTTRGVEPGVSCLLARGAWKPFVYAGMPVFIPDGAHVGIHGSVGLQWDPSPHAGVHLGIGVEHFFSAPPGYDRTILVPSAGLQARL